MEKEEFITIAKEIKPLIEQLMETLDQCGVESMSSLTMDTNGYFYFTLHDEKYHFVRTNRNRAAKVDFEIEI